MDDDELLRLMQGLTQRPIHVCRIESALERAISANTTAVWLSRYTIEKQLHRHRDIQIEHYRLLPTIIKYGVAVQDTAKTISFLYPDDSMFGRPLHAVIKRVKMGHEIYVETYHLTRHTKINKIMRRGTVLRDWGG